MSQVKRNETEYYRTWLLEDIPVNKTGSQNVQPNTDTAVLWDMIETQNYVVLSAGTLTIKKEGFYSIQVQIIWEANLGGGRWAWIKINSSSVKFGFNIVPSSTGVVETSNQLQLQRKFVVGDTIEIWTRHDDSGQNVIEGTTNSPNLYSYMDISLFQSTA